MLSQGTGLLFDKGLWHFPGSKSSLLQKCCLGGGWDWGSEVFGAEGVVRGGGVATGRGHRLPGKRAGAAAAAAALGVVYGFGLYSFFLFLPLL